MFFVLFWLVGESLHYLAIGLLAHFISVPQAFFAHRRLVFHSRGPRLAEFVRYNLSHVAGLATGLALLTAGVELLKLSAPVAQAIATVVTVALSWAPNASWIV